MRRIVVISYTETGRQLNRRLTDYFIQKKDVAFSVHCGKDRQTMPVKEGMEARVQDCGDVLCREWQRTTAFVFIGAMGIVVRYIAPLLESKLCDPAVLVLDEKGQFVIPILSGHIGGGVAIARELAGLLGAQAVITTATDVEAQFAVDVFAQNNHLWIENPACIRNISAALLRGMSVELWTGLPVERAVEEVPDEAAKQQEEQFGQTQGQYGIRGKRRIVLEGQSLSECAAAIAVELPQEELAGLKQRYGAAQVCVLRARQYILGVGCKKGKTAEELEDFLRQLCRRLHIEIWEIAAVASIDVKREEDGIWELSRRLGASYEVFSAEELEQVQASVSASAFVKETVGVDNVCERSAYCLAERWASEYRLVSGKQAQNGMTMAIVQVKLRLVW